VHPEQGDLGRNWPLDLGIVSDEKVFIEALANGLRQKSATPGLGKLPRPGASGKKPR
jgi:hypothetical protein